jgi:hypothetical protein
VVVFLTESPEPGIAFQLSASADTLRLTGVSRIYQSMLTGRRWTQVTAAANASDPSELHLSDLFDGQSPMLILQVDSILRPGSRAFTPWKVDASATGNLRVSGAEGALVWVRDPAADNRIHIYAPVGQIELEIDRADLPSGVGPANGSLVGRLSFEGAGLIAQVDQNGTRIVGQVSTQTEMIYAEFSVSQRIQPLGGVRAGIAGGPISFEPTQLGSPLVALWQGGLLVQAGGVTSDGRVMNTQIWAGSPTAGDLAVGRITVEELAAGNTYIAGRTFVWTETGLLNDLLKGSNFGNLALSTGGSLRITRLDAPGTDTWGSLEAVLTTQQALFLGGSPNATQEMTLEIVAPIAPTSRYAMARPPSILTNSDTIRFGPGIVRVANGNISLPGRVFETLVTPVPDVLITLSWSGGSATVRTNQQGDFEFTGLNPGRYEVRFEVPLGLQLADRQRAVIGPLDLVNDQETWLPIALADAQGNGALRVIAGSSGTNTTVDGVQARVRAEGSSTVITTLITGNYRPGMDLEKLQPGRYEVDLVVPAGYKFVAGQSSSESVEIRKGHESVIFVGVVRM